MADDQTKRSWDEWIVVVLQRIAGWAMLAFVATVLWSALNALTEPPKPGTQQRTRFDQDRALCRMAAACKKYSEARLECATAGNFKTCLHIKMGADASYSGMCSGYDEGAAAVPLPPETPNAVQCFFLTFWQ
jgi:hypothetical protein